MRLFLFLACLIPIAAAVTWPPAASIPGTAENIHGTTTTTTTKERQYISPLTTLHVPDIGTRRALMTLCNPEPRTIELADERLTGDNNNVFVYRSQPRNHVSVFSLKQTAQQQLQSGSHEETRPHWQLECDPGELLDIVRVRDLNLMGPTVGDATPANTPRTQPQVASSSSSDVDSSSSDICWRRARRIASAGLLYRQPENFIMKACERLLALQQALMGQLILHCQDKQKCTLPDRLNPLDEGAQPTPPLETCHALNKLNMSESVEVEYRCTPTALGGGTRTVTREDLANRVSCAPGGRLFVASVSLQVAPSTGPPYVTIIDTWAYRHKFEEEPDHRGDNIGEDALGEDSDGAPAGRAARRRRSASSDNVVVMPLGHCSIPASVVEMCQGERACSLSFDLLERHLRARHNCLRLIDMYQLAFNYTCVHESKWDSWSNSKYEIALTIEKLGKGPREPGAAAYVEQARYQTAREASLETEEASMSFNKRLAQREDQQPAARSRASDTHPAALASPSAAGALSGWQPAHSLLVSLVNCLLLFPLLIAMIDINQHRIQLDQGH